MCLKEEGKRDLAGDGEGVGSENGQRELHLLLRNGFKSCPNTSLAPSRPLSNLIFYISVS